MRIRGFPAYKFVEQSSHGEIGSPAGDDRREGNDMEIIGMAIVFVVLVSMFAASLVQH